MPRFSLTPTPQKQKRPKALGGVLSATYLQSLGTYFVSKALLDTETPTNATASFAMHFHNTEPSTVTLDAEGAGSATSVFPLLVYGTNNKLPPPAAAVVVMVITPVVDAISILLTFLVAPPNV